MVMRIRTKLKKTKIKTPWPLVRKRTIPTERPRSQCQLLWIEGVAWSTQRIPPVVDLVFLTGAATLSFK
jgi:hypothetical protein